MNDPYKVLGVDKKAIKSEIKKAFRAKAKKHHTDINACSNDKMIETNNAWAVLKDDKKRDEYDRTGDVKINNENGVAIGKINGYFFALLNSKKDLSRIDIIESIRISLMAEKQKNYELVSLGKQYEKKIQKLVDRIKNKDKGPNYFDNIIQDKLAETKKGIASFEQELEIIKKSLVLLDKFKDTGVIVPEGPTPFQAFTQFSVTGTASF
jgi:curved DNA-binding protein CbpA